MEPTSEISVCGFRTADEEATSKEAENLDDLTKVKYTGHCEKPEDERCSKGEGEVK